MKTIKIQLTRDGGAQMLHDDEVDLSEFGPIQIRRASHIEPWTAKDGTVRWAVISAKTGLIVHDSFKTRAEALEWEKKFYSPTGLGWAELTGKVG